jgi:hypothetical protein
MNTASILFLILFLTISCSENEFRELSPSEVILNDFNNMKFDLAIECDGESALEKPEYIKHFHIKAYKEIRMDLDSNIVLGGGPNRKFAIGNRKGVISQNKQFDRMGNTIVEYAYLAEGPFIERFSYKYDIYGKIIERRELSYCEVIPTRKYYYSKSSDLDSIHYYDISRVNDSISSVRSREIFIDEKELILYDHSGNGSFDTIPNRENAYSITLDSCGRVVGQQTKFQCCKYQYKNGLIIKELALDKNCDEQYRETIYLYDNQGLLRKRISNDKWERIYIYKFFENLN